MAKQFVSSVISNEEQAKIEKVLRLYGVTSSGSYHSRSIYYGVNVQATNNKELVDFGSYMVEYNYNKYVDLSIYPSSLFHKQTSLIPRYGIPYDVM